MHLEHLNERQKIAVKHTDGPLMVLAGAGAGKTRVITHRIVHLIKHGILPHNILAVTFTNKAAKEMRERVLKLIDTDLGLNRPVAHRGGAEGTPRARSAQVARTVPLVCTFHSLGASLLREHARTLGLKRHFTIFDRADSIRAVKQALKTLALDPKQFEPRVVLSVISKHKGDGIPSEGFRPQKGNVWQETVGLIWREYEKILQREGALDFDDLLLRTLMLLQEHKDALTLCRTRWTHLHIDEYQDTNKVQFAIAELLAGKRANICVVGDIDQCLAKGTLITMADGKTRPIERVREGDEILSNYGGGIFKPARVTKTFAKKYNGTLIRITTKKGGTVTSTPEHTHFAGFHLGTTPQLYFTYLMYKRGVGWRIGTSQTNTKGQRISVVGFIQRSHQEHADATWVLATHATPSSARVLEYTLSLQYSIPTLPFVARKGQSANGYVHNQKTINRIFSTFDTDASAKKLLGAYGLSFKHPHHSPRSRNGSRNRIVLTLCGERRGCSPLHRISMVGNDRERKKILGHLGLSVRSAKASSRSWRFETAHKDWGMVKEIAERITKAIPECEVVEVARLGKVNDGRGTKNACSLPFLPASSVREGMALCDAEGMWNVVEKIECMPNSHSTVYDLNIERSHNFIANGIVTHNSIYSWRGANLENLLLFEDEFPDTTTVVLEENYRSTQTILSAANQVIAKNVKRKEKNLFTNNAKGEPIGVYSAYSEDDEANFVAERAGALIESGVPAREIAVLYRANFQSRALEQAFMYAGIPYQVLGTRFFDRREVKDVLSYLRASLNPDSRGDIARIVSAPPRGIGKMTLAKMLDGKEATLAPLAQAKVAEFKSVLTRIRETALSSAPSATIRFIAEASGLEKTLKEGSDEDKERFENIKELATVAAKYDALPPQEGVEKLLEDAALATDQDSLDNPPPPPPAGGGGGGGADAVKLMTVHASKGLEFDYVFITGLEEGLFPHAKLDEDADEEEERRLFYVALTRARKKVFLVHSLVRTIYGTQALQQSSQFIEDIDEELLEYENDTQLPHERKVDLIDF